MLQVSAFSKHCVASKQEQAGCLGSSVIFIQSLPASHVSNDGVLKLHSQVGGTVVILQVSALVRQVAESKQEHPGCPGLSVTFMHTRLVPHGSDVGVLKLHSHIDGYVLILQVSAFSKQFVSVKQEHGGCPGVSVIFKHVLPSSQGVDNVLKLHSQLEGVMVILHVSDVSGHDSSSTQEHAGCPGCSVVFTHIIEDGHAANVGALKLHPQVGGLVVMLQVSALCKQ